MKKPERIRRVLEKWVPQLGDKKENLQIFVDDGEVAARAGATLSFEYRYNLEIVVLDYAGDMTAIAVPLLAWIAQEQPELLQKQDGKPFTYKREVLDNDTSDISFTLELTERVRVAKREEGEGFDVTYVEEPRGLDEFPGVCGVNLWELFLRDDLVAESSDPAHTGG